MTKQKIVERLVRKSGLKKREVSFIIDNFLDSITKSVNDGDKVEIRGFGSFSRVIRKGRRVYSPIAKKHLLLPGKSVVAFKASKTTEITLE